MSVVTSHLHMILYDSRKGETEKTPSGTVRVIIYLNGTRTLQCHYPLQVLLQDDSRTFQAGLSQPVTTQPEALGVNRGESRVEVHLFTTKHTQNVDILV